MIPKNTNITEEMNQKIIELNKIGFNWSKWVRDKFYEDFLIDDEKINSELKSLHDRINELEVQKKQIKENRTKFYGKITSKEKEFLILVPKLLTEGKELFSLLKRFNTEQEKDWDIFKFKNAIKYLQNMR
jgi:predicted nuclease with TOPRIM domain